MGTVLQKERKRQATKIIDQIVDHNREGARRRSAAKIERFEYRCTDWYVVLVVCSDGRLNNPEEILGIPLGASEVWRLAGLLDAYGVIALLKHGVEQAKKSGKNLLIVETIHTDCKALGNDILLGKIMLEQHRMLIETEYPKYEDGETKINILPVQINLPNYEIELLDPVNSYQTIYSTARVEDGLPVSLRRAECRTEGIGYLQSELEDLTGFTPEISRCLATAFFGNATARDNLTRRSGIHQEKWVGIGSPKSLSWVVDDRAFVISSAAKLDNLGSISSSMDIGIDLTRSNLAEEEPVIVGIFGKYNSRIPGSELESLERLGRFYASLRPNLEQVTENGEVEPLLGLVNENGILEPRRLL